MSVMSKGLTVPAQSYFASADNTATDGRGHPSHTANNVWYTSSSRTNYEPSRASSTANTGHFGHRSSHIIGAGHESVVEDQRRISSVIVREEYLSGNGAPPADEVKYVEVPFIEEVIRTVPRREVVEIEKRVPKIEYQYVDKTVEIPKIEYVDRIVEVPQYQEDVKYVHKHEVIDVPREVIEHVPRIENRVREEIIDVPGQVIEVPKRHPYEKEVIIPRYIKEEQPVVVAQTLRPEFIPSQEMHHVNVNHYEAEIVEVEVPIPKVVDLPVRLKGIVSEEHQPVEVPAAQYNSMLKLLNPHMTQSQLTEALVLRRDGTSFPELRAEEARMFLPLLDQEHYAVQRNQTDIRHLTRDRHQTNWSNNIIGAPSIPLRPMRASPALRASPPYASNLGINSVISTFPAYESTYISAPRTSRKSKRSQKKIHY
eukprot:Gregarina_sp_Poly_1__1768@NODE_1459_length_4095_cov_53_046425_g966_i0_p1_GENE_NODE_1459_length_4095_cov_53_046425_g966_i0NODE_1459_length_4095_cov_53_046425_g966_i0_p1_ORF_typecomplete_len426_score36_26IMCp/PF12314_8/0_079IMCp/PF12314_8/3_4e13IMCp/PF12314_8/1_8e04IMCp/PF12314_8/2_5e03_NODE_1459_length_4095_cov_53_046425_g966_i011932470